jgi:hypothetical protein
VAFVNDKAKQGWQITLCHFLKGKIPKLFVAIRVKVGMLSGKETASAAVEPHIKTLICQVECH